jgi:hypothetical protein
VQRVLIRPPMSRVGPLTIEGRQAQVGNDFANRAKYGKRLDAPSARERIHERNSPAGQLKDKVRRFGKCSSCRAAQRAGDVILLTASHSALEFRSSLSEAVGGLLMKASQRISGAGASLDPETMKVIGQSFDEAWARIAGRFGSDPTLIESARLSLANAILAAATNASRDVGALKNEALKTMARRYPSLGPHV